jgi:hypothetical protein
MGQLGRGAGRHHLRHRYGRSHGGCLPPKGKPRVVVPARPEEDAEHTRPVAVDRRSGLVYFANQDVAQVFSVDRQGRVATVAGTGEPGFSGDGGPATAAQLYQPMGLAVDSRLAALYFSDNVTNRIRRVDANGVITTVAGTGPKAASGDGGPATLASFDPPELRSTNARRRCTSLTPSLTRSAGSTPRGRSPRWPGPGNRGSPETMDRRPWHASRRPPRWRSIPALGRCISPTSATGASGASMLRV